MGDEAIVLAIFLGFFVVAVYILWAYSSTKWGHRYQTLIEQYDLFLLHKVVDKRVPDLLGVMSDKYSSRNKKVRKKLEDEMDAEDDKLKKEE